MAVKDFIVKNGLQVKGAITADSDVVIRGNIQVSGTITGDGSGLSGVTSYVKANFDSDFATKTTDDLTEGTTNLYYDSATTVTVARNSIIGGTGITYTANTGIIDITNTGVSAATYGDSSTIPRITVNEQGQITAVIGASVNIPAGYDKTNFDSDFATKTTDDLTEGSINLYYDSSRTVTVSRNSISVTGDLTYSASTGVISYADTRDLFDSADFDTAFSAKTTDNLTEGSTNLYYDSARTITVARNSVSVTDAGGDGSLTYSAATGIITYTGPSAAEARAHFSGGTGVTINNGVIAIGQAVGTGDTPTFNGLSAGNAKITALLIPTDGTDAANKAYVDEVATGLAPAPAVDAATTTNLDGTFDSDGTAVGYLGVGTLTAIVNGAIGPIDDVSIDSGDSLLLKDQTTAFQNGRWNVSYAGDSNNPWVLIRCSQCDSSDEIAGKFIFITGGTLYGNTGWVLTVTDPETFVINRDPIIPIQFSGAGTFTNGYGLNLNGTEFSLDSAETITLTRTGLSAGTGINYNSGTGVISYDSSTVVITARNSIVGGTGITYTASTGTIATNDGAIVHDNLSGFVANEHIDHSGVTITAGSGLTGGGDITATRTLNVGAGTGITVSADAVAIDSSGLATYFSKVIVHDNTSGFVANEHIDHSTISIVAGDGLTGGGNITTSRTINIGAGTGITVSADAISTNDAAIIHDNLSGFVANEHIDHSTVSITAGDGLTGGGNITTSRTLNIGAGTGITVNADNIAITNTGVIAATYGDSSTIPRITVNAQGQITAVVGASVNIPAGYDKTNFDSDFATKTTTNLTEGTNLYHTAARARSAISITDAGGDGSLAYNSGTGVITYTGPSAAEVRAHISAGTGISFTSGVIANTGVLSVNSVTGAVTAANLLTAINSVDGAGSGLDADLLDGQQGSYYRIDVYNAAGTLLN